MQNRLRLAMVADSRGYEYICFYVRQYQTDRYNLDDMAWQVWSKFVLWRANCDRFSDSDQRIDLALNLMDRLFSELMEEDEEEEEWKSLITVCCLTWFDL